MFKALKKLFMKKKIGVRQDYTIEIYRDGKLHSIDKGHNLVPNEGLIEFLKLINGQSTATSKYIGLGTATYTPSASETGATVSTSVGEWVGYSESTRPQWVIPAITTTTIDNSASLAVFTATTGATIKNVFAITDATKGGSAGKCVSVLNLPASRTLVANDVIKIQFGQTIISQ